MLGLKNDEILTCLLLIVVGYIIAKMFSKRCEGLSNGNEAPITMCPSTKVDACWYHTDDCNKKYTDDSADSGFHTCKKGGLFSAYCISSGNECRLKDGDSCEYNSDCLNSSCVNRKCISTPPSPPLPSCPSGQSYCMNQNICVDKCRSGQELSSQCICLPKCCSKQTCTDPHECDP